MNAGMSCSTKQNINELKYYIGYSILNYVGISIKKIARRTTGAKGCNFLAGLLQVSYMFLKHILKVCSKSLKVSYKSPRSF
jgi:hypothetical protein